MSVTASDAGEFLLWGLIPGGNLIQAGMEVSEEASERKAENEARKLKSQIAADKAAVAKAKADAANAKEAAKAAQAAADAAQDDAEAQTEAAAAAKEAAAAAKVANESAAELALSQSAATSAEWTSKLEAIKPYAIGLVGTLLATATGVFLWRRYG